MRAVTMTEAETRIYDAGGEPWDRLRQALYDRCQRAADEAREDVELYTADGITVEAFVADRSAPPDPHRYRAAVWTSRDRQRSIVFTNVEDSQQRDDEALLALAEREIEATGLERERGDSLQVEWVREKP